MSPEFTAGMFTLAGAAVGFTAAVVAEMIRSRASSARELADRRCRFQIETLVRIQEVAERLYSHAREDVHAYRNPQPCLANRDVEQSISRREDQIETISELEMLAYRVHHPLIQRMALVLISGAATPASIPEDEFERREERARLSYHAIEEVCGYEINRLLGHRKSSARARRRNRELPYPGDKTKIRSEDGPEGQDDMGWHSYKF